MQASGPFEPTAQLGTQWHTDHGPPLRLPGYEPESGRYGAPSPPGKCQGATAAAARATPRAVSGGTPAWLLEVGSPAGHFTRAPQGGKLGRSLGPWAYGMRLSAP